MIRAIAFAITSAAASAWAVYLVKLHQDAVLRQLDPTALCGVDGGCGDVLASSWSTIAGVPVSVPATPMYGVLAFLGVLTALGRFSAERLAGLAGLIGLSGLAFGGWLLFHMLSDVGAVCNYCLVMDGLGLGKYRWIAMGWHRAVRWAVCAPQQCANSPG